jgi:hypothetical protein
LEAIVERRENRILDGRPERTACITIGEDYSAFVYGRWDEEDGVTFAEALRREGIPVKEDSELSGGSISYEELWAYGHLEPNAPEYPV